MSFSRFPFLRYFFALSIGIVLYDYFRFYHVIIWGIELFCCLFYAFFYFQKKRISNVFQGTFGIVFLVISGYLFSHFNIEKNSIRHFSHQLNKAQYLEVNTTSLVEEKTNVWKTIGQVNALIINGKRKLCNGQILVNIDNQTTEKPQYGDVFVVKNSCKIIEPPKNPHEFDYKRFLTLQNVDFSVYCTGYDIQKIDYHPNYIIEKIAFQTNRFADSVLTHYLISKRSHGLAIAMILGTRDEIDFEQMQAFSASGAIHVLSVSGLHVGVIYLVLFWIFGFLTKKDKWGNISLFIIVFSILWFYALLTGLSAPVLRSTIMFSLFLIGKIWNKNNNNLNTLFFSAFCLLIWKPYFLFNVGFQLSYLAVLGMILFQPIMVKWIEIDKKISLTNYCLDKLWKITTVAVSAQLATFPITIYYFHQFPNYFLIVNPPIILLSSVILIYGLAYLLIAKLLIVFQLFKLLDWLSFPLDWFCKMLNKTVLFTDKQPFATTHFLHFSKLELWVFYFLVLGLIFLYIKKSFRWTVISIICGLLLVCSHILFLFQKQHQSILVFNSIKKHTCISVLAGSKAYLIADSLFISSPKNVSFRMNSFWSYSGVKDTCKININAIQHIKNQDIEVNSNTVFSVINWGKCTILLLKEKVNSDIIKYLPSKIDYLILNKKSSYSMVEILKNKDVKNTMLMGESFRSLPQIIEKNISQTKCKFYDLERNGYLMIENKK